MGCTWIKHRLEYDSKPCSQGEVPASGWAETRTWIGTNHKLQFLFKTNLKQTSHILPSQAQSTGWGLILHFLGRTVMPVLRALHHHTSPLFGALSCFPHQKPVVPHFFPPPHQERNKGWQSPMARDQGIWGLVYYMLNRALNYWWLLPSLTAFLKREIWANKHVSWKSPCSDRSWQEKKHPGFMTVYY